MSKKKCWFALEQTNYGVPTGKFFCHITKDECETAEKFESCDTWKEYRGLPIAL